MMITQIALYVAPLFILSYLLKTLGVAQFGNYALILSIVAYLQIITDYGFSLVQVVRSHRIERTKNIYQKFICQL